MAILATLNTEVAERLPTVPSEFDSADRDRAIVEALSFYNDHRENEVIADIAGSGVFDLALPAGFDQDLSTVVSVEYPAGQRVPCILAADTYQIYDDGGGTKVLRLLDETPAAGETVRLTYSLPYDLAALPVRDEYVVIYYACGQMCDWISAHYASSTRSTIGTDSAEHLQQQLSWSDRAQRFHDLAFELMGFDMTAGQNGRSRGSGGSGGIAAGGPSSPASGFADWVGTEVRESRYTH